MIPGKKINKKLLSGKEKFFSKLSNKEISDRDYRHAQRI